MPEHLIFVCLFHLPYLAAFAAAEYCPPPSPGTRLGTPPVPPCPPVPNPAPAPPETQFASLDSC